MTNIFATRQINILSDHKTVFNYISNLENDKFWRKEINSTTMTSKPQIGAVAEEDSFLSKKTPSNVLKLKCIEFTQDEKVVYQTLPDSNFYLKSIRQVEPIGENNSLLTYTIEFDKSIVKHGLGFGLPKFIIDFVVKSDLKKYLKNVKSLIETQNPNQ